MSEQDLCLATESDDELPKGSLSCGSTFWVSTQIPETFDVAGFDLLNYERVTAK